MEELAQDVDHGTKTDAPEQGHGLMGDPANRAVGHESAQADVVFERFGHLLSEVVNVVSKGVVEGLDLFRCLAAVCRGRWNGRSQGFVPALFLAGPSGLRGAQPGRQGRALHRRSRDAPTR